MHAEQCGLLISEMKATTIASGVGSNHAFVRQPHHVQCHIVEAAENLNSPELGN